jgi:LEA14-like dessication related protein
MKKTAIFVSMIALTIISCATVDQNIKARKDLEKCRYDLDSIEVVDVKLDGAQIKDADFNIYLKITNTTDGDVALDSVDGDLYLDDAKTTDIIHKNFVRIKKGQSSVEKIYVSVPVGSVMKLLGHKPENITVDARVKVNILIGSHTLETPFVAHVKKTFPIPWDRINEMFQKKLDQVIDSAADKGKEKGKERIKKIR